MSDTEPENIPSNWASGPGRAELLDRAIWYECECCEDFLCSIHSAHAYDCVCPTIDQWAETEWNPYLDILTPEIETWVGDKPCDDDD